MEERERESFLLSSPKFYIIDSKESSDHNLRSFRTIFNLACIDQSNPWKASLSWSVFFLFCVLIPILSHFVLACSSSCDDDHKQPFDAIVELSLSSISALSFLSLASFARKHGDGILKFIFVDKYCQDSDKVLHGSTIQLQRSIGILCIFVLPCFVVDTAYKIWWYVTGGSEIPHWGNLIVSHSIACMLEQLSWLYRTSIFLLACVLYRASCYHQFLRLQDFTQVFRIEMDVASLLSEHLKIRMTLKTISHRFRVFILFTLLIVTASQFASLLVTTETGSNVDIYTAGELALCSITLVTGLCICLRSSAKITHKAQSITSLAAKWHVVSTTNSFDGTDDDTPTLQSNSPRVFPFNANCESDDEVGDEDELDNTNLMPTFVNTISYQKRQALVTYLENNKAGITVFGCTIDRTYLHTIFGVELSLVLWLLSKTVGIS